MASRGWTCRRVRCGVLNDARKRKCTGCGSPAPKKRVPAHKQALRDVTYEQYVQVNQDIHGVGELCGVCGRERDQDRRLDRDHEHATLSPYAGKPRGLACPRCNILMPPKLTPEIARLIAAYLTRVEDYYAEQAA